MAEREVGFHDLTPEAQKRAFLQWEGGRDGDGAWLDGLWEKEYGEAVKEMQAGLDWLCKETGLEVAVPRSWGSLYIDLRFRRVNVDDFDETKRVTADAYDDVTFQLGDFYDAMMDEMAEDFAKARKAINSYWDTDWPWRNRTSEQEIAEEEAYVACQQGYRVIEDGMNERTRRLAMFVVDLDDAKAEDLMSFEHFEDYFVPDHRFSADGTVLWAKDESRLVAHQRR